MAEQNAVNLETIRRKLIVVKHIINAVADSIEDVMNNADAFYGELIELLDTAAEGIDSVILELGGSSSEPGMEESGE